VEQPAVKAGQQDEQTEATSVAVPKPKRAKADLCIKKILRLFRKEVKDLYFQLYGSKQYHWIASTSRKNLRYFFTAQQFRGIDGT